MCKCSQVLDERGQKSSKIKDPVKKKKVFQKTYLESTQVEILVMDWSKHIYTMLYIKAE